MPQKKITLNCNVMKYEVYINDVLYEFDKEYTIYQACNLKQIYLPCFCYHDQLSIAGNCRMCLVVANSALVASCAINIAQGMYIYTNTKRVNEARESVLEFILINHPLDCPICDQGGDVIFKIYLLFLVQIEVVFMKWINVL
jgi:NADH-quinone oxidoreductase subunit G